MKEKCLSSCRKNTDHRFTLRETRLGASQIGWGRYCLLVIAIAAQLATVFITWPLWQVRVDPPNLPLIGTPGFSCGVVIVASLVYMLLDPCRGWVLHVVLVALASVCDQFRMQPQFLAIIVLMFAVVSAKGLIVCRWFLAALWLWAGIHKLFSPHWFAHASYWILEGLPLAPSDIIKIHWSFALAVAFSEIVVGFLAIFVPRIAAYFCSALHVSIFLLLVVIHWNYSVLPWNAATAIIGFWVMSNSPGTQALLRGSNRYAWVSEAIVAVVLFVIPSGFYLGVCDHGYANVLYSDYVPRGLITGKEKLREISGWDPVHVPFPYERRTHKQFFELVANQGDKLHIFDPRPLLNDQFFVFNEFGIAEEITREQFYASNTGQAAGIGIDDRYAKFWLRQCGELTQRWYAGKKSRRDNLVTYAYTLEPEHYSARALQMLSGLPNLEELQLQGCPVRDDDLQHVADLKRLKGIGLSDTGVTDAGLEYLTGLPRLKILEVENTRISPDGLERLKKSLGY